MKWLLVAAITLAGSAGFLTAMAVGGPTALTPSKTVTLNLTNGQEGPPGPPGPEGPPGPGITMKGTVATPADLPQQGNKQGDTYIVSSDGSMQVWDGTRWVSGGPVGGTGTNGQECPAGYTFNALTLNSPGGHVTLAACIQD